MQNINAVSILAVVKVARNGAPYALVTFNRHGGRKARHNKETICTFIPRALAAPLLHNKWNHKASKALRKWLAESLGATTPAEESTFGDFRSALAAGMEPPDGWQDDPRKVAYFLQTQHMHCAFHPMNKRGVILRNYDRLSDTAECMVSFYVKTYPEARTRGALAPALTLPLDGAALVAAMRKAGAVNGSGKHAYYDPNRVAMRPFAIALLLAGLS